MVASRSLPKGMALPDDSNPSIVTRSTGVTLDLSDLHKAALFLRVIGGKAEQLIHHKPHHRQVA